ncbi:TetR/AcrR family transcriptional regulator [Streptomyces sp. NPDC002730]|uniref:TetR/AcrR family transcriptional regulator n=1 Tax=Streptomyces sp. NPDC002730 TaxID=3364662 RepID=UPI0036A2BFBE
MTPTTQGPRARYREQTRAEIKEAALRQLAEGGLAAIALTRIAKEMGMSGPALYRYFANRDDLLSALIRDAYDDLAEAIGVAAEACAVASQRARLHALADAFRAWGVEQPHRYLLIAGPPLPGYSAPADTVARARAALGPFLSVFVAGEPSGPAVRLVEQMTAWAEREPAVASWAEQYTELPASGSGVGRALAGAVLAWSQMHGAVSLEVAGQFTGMGHDPGTLLDAQIDALADAFRLD